jgi:pantoate--beta-alanine ligase
MQSLALAWRKEGQEVGLVPTMGALHAGHESLIRRARSDNQRLVVSIFVNPLQFGRGEDLERYPRPFERDAAICDRLGADALFHPGLEQMYPASFRTGVDPGPLAETLEGSSRPGHFKGVLTVVLKLFSLLQPHRAYFGQKDLQQLILVRQMVRDFGLPVRIVACPTVREPDGLAMSSRNAYLTPAQREVAPAIYQSLKRGAAAFKAGLSDPEFLEAEITASLAQARQLEPDYVACLQEVDLKRPRVAVPGNFLAVAVKLGSIRLIDNLVLGAETN